MPAMRPRLPRRGALRLGLAAVLALAAFVPAAAPGAAAMSATGAVAGGIDYPDPNGLWYIGCQGATWSLGLTGAAAGVDLVNNESAGITSISATGSTPCAFLLQTESGPVSLSASSNGVLGLIDCPTMTGTYTRTLLLWTISVSGDCTLNGKPEPGEQLTVSFTGAPTSIGGDGGSFTSLAVAGTASWS